jgi:hypothetical protein
VKVLKAYRVHDGDPMEDCLLVFCSSVSRAKTLAFALGWMEDWTDLRVQRQPKWDAFAKEEKVIEQNSDLPWDAPKFYDPYYQGDW